MHGDFSGAILVLDTGIPCNNVCDKAAHDVDAHLTSVLQRAADARHRVLLVLSGSATWCQQAVQTWWSAASSRVWIGEREGAETLPISKVKQLLGSEYALVVIDAHAGLSPDALASVAGTVVAGGALIVLTPPWQQWGEAADADYARLASYPHDWHILPARFLQRMRSTLTTCFSHETLIAHIQESEVGLAWTLPATTALQRIASSSDASPARDTVPNHSQQQCLDKLAAHHGTAVLLADRGFGKSALLGFAARQWIAEGKAVCVMAPSRAAAASVFRHAGEGLLFCAPDQIAAHDVVDVLLVDEAAVIPLPALLSTLTRFPRVIFATTVDGYEGTGRGFVLRFLRELDRQCAGWLALQLDAPVRWAQDDPLTRWLYQSLLLDAQEPVLLSPKIEDVAGDVPIMVIEEISQAQLAADNALLVDIYGLLRSAHYRTTPDDLRFLLDAPNVLLYRLQQAGCTVAVVLLVEEGQLDEAIAQEIVAGRRRPRGHLLVQSLAIHLRHEVFLRQRVARVVRIAVHTQYQGRGLGSQLLQAVVDRLRGRGVNAVGSSFSASAEVLHFWQKNGFELLRVGYRRHAASAEPSALVLRVLDDLSAC